MSFEILGVAPQLVAKLKAMNIVSPLPIQQLVIPEALGGRSVLVTSQTGSGKTLAYLLPLIQGVASIENRKARALVLAPTRELAQQIAQVCSCLGETLSLKCSVIVGGVGYDEQRKSLSQNPEIIIATPGRLIDLLEQGAVDINQLDYFVLDEVDQMLDLGFREPILKLSQLRAASAATFCFSATLPQEVEDLVNDLSPSIARLSLEGEKMAVESVDHLGYFVSFEMMDRLLIHLLRSESAAQSIIFTRSRKMADRVVGLLLENSITAEAMHSDRSQAAREHILSRFRCGETSIIVATDVIARGIDIDSVTHVFNFGLPQNAEQYIHRCGRCGRVGRSGRAISMFTVEEKPMLDAICRLMKRNIIIDNAHPYLTPDVTRALTMPMKGKSKRKK
ncbi:MAG: DEAD/DEAH box helicase [Rikenellaceae bacterium]